MEIISSADSIQIECRRCGECCRKGSPTLHLEDAELLKNGILTYQDIYTIRKGELVYNNIEDKIITLGDELIKIKEKKDSRICIFLKENANECTIYDQRPLQCKEHECWNPEKLINAFLGEKLARKHLVQGNRMLIDIVEMHNDKCSYPVLNHLLERIQSGEDLVTDVFDVLQFDSSIRQYLQEKIGVPHEYLPLLLGRPLVETIESFGYKVERDEKGHYCLITS